MYRLFFQSGKNKGKRLLVRQAVAVIGSGPSCHLRLPETECPPAEAFRLETRPGGVAVIPLDASLPLTLHNAPVEGEPLLTHGDVLMLGDLSMEYQEIIPPFAPRLPPGGGVLQPMTWLAIVGILVVEFALVAFTFNWPRYIIEPNVEKIDIAYAEKIRLQKEAAGEPIGEEAQKSATAADLVVMPGSSAVDSHKAATNTAGTSTAIATSATAAVASTGPATHAPTSSPPLPAPIPAALREALDEADFAPVDISNVIVELPPEALYDPIQENVQSLLNEADVAAQFADYPRAFRLLNQIHQLAPDFIPAHIHHARLLEARGDFDAAYQRWRQLLGLVSKDNPARAEILQACRKLRARRNMQASIQGFAGVDPATLPRHYRLTNVNMQKMPSDSEIAEMRVLRGQIELISVATSNSTDETSAPVPPPAGTSAPLPHRTAALPPSALSPSAVSATPAPTDSVAIATAPVIEDTSTIQLFITFYDLEPDGRPVPTRALVSPSPLHFTRPISAAGTLPFEATYIVPTVRRLETQELMPHTSVYYGYTLHLFVGEDLQDADAKPLRLLELPIHIPESAED